MSELLLKIDNHSDPKNYQDGDIICAFNQRRIKCVHAQHICNINLSGYNRDGLRPDGISRKYQEFTYEYKFERISRTEVKCIELSSMEEEVFSNVPNAKGKYIYVELYLKDAVELRKVDIFGTKGREYWYGGKTDVSSPVISSVWNMIETDTPKREVDHTLWPLTPHEKRVFLALGVDDFIDEQASSLVEPELVQIGVDKDGKPIMEVVKKRKNKVDWQSISLPKSKTEIQDRSNIIDIRQNKLVRSSIIIRK